MADSQLLTEPAGIGGWLVLPLIGLIAWPVSYAYELWAVVLPELEWVRTVSSSVLSAYWAPYLATVAIIDGALCVAAVVLLVLFLQRRRVVPRAISLFYLANAAVVVFRLASAVYLAAHESGGVSVASSSFARQLLSLAATVIWILYFQRSVRVRNTFDR